MFRIGCHLSSAKGYLHMAEEIMSLSGNTFQYFSRNPRGGELKAFDEKDAEAYVNFKKENGISGVITHAPYVLNLSAKDEPLRTHSYHVMREDLQRLEYFDDALYNFHPGAHVSQGSRQGIEYISYYLNLLTKEVKKTKILLETMAGKGTELGRNFTELSEIFRRLDEPEKVGVCLDTCHVFDGGYDLRNHLDDMISEFDSEIGLSRLYGIHLNDSKNETGSRKDRHEKIGEGNIGIETFRKIINHPALRDLPFVLETPNELPGYRKEIALLRELREEN